MTIARVLIIAGSDSGGGAGIQADIRTVTMLGGHPMTAITAITAQNTLGVQRVLPLPIDLVADQFTSVVGDIGVDAIKIGMLGNANLAEMVWDLLIGMPNGLPIVFDPVMIATSGATLADGPTVAAFFRLMELATVVTPNIPELAALGGAAAVLEHGCALLLKGGHADGEVVTDRLVNRDGEIARWSHPRIHTAHTHGTGCTLASGIATGMAQGLSLPDATGRAIAYVQATLAAAPGIGGGHGPMGHALGVRPFDMLAGR